MTTDDAEARTRARSKGGKLPPGVYWRHQTLWIAYYVTGPDGRRVQHREPTEATSPREAAELRATRVTDHKRGERTIESDTLTVADAVDTVLAEYEKQGRRSLRTARGYAKAIKAALGGDLAIAVGGKIDAVQIRWQRAGLTNATINRRCNLLRRGLRLLLRQRRLPFVPFIERLEEDSPRARYITAADATAIRAALPPYVADVFSLALLLGIRKGQLARTLRRYVDLDAGVMTWPPAECKHKETHTVPLDEAPFAIVARAMDTAVPWCPFLFHGPDCKPGHAASKSYGCVGDFKKAFRHAVEEAGLPFGRKAGGYVFHHTRNTAATDLRAGGLGEDDCMQVGGWKTRHVFAHYNLGDTDALRARLAASRRTRSTVVPLRRREGGGTR